MKDTFGGTRRFSKGGRLTRLLALGLLLLATLVPAAVAAAGSESAGDPYAGQETIVEPAPDCRTAPAPYPTLTCVQDGGRRFTLWTPAAWQTVALLQEHDGAFMVMPDLNNWRAKFRIQVTDSTDGFTASDVPELAASFDTLIHALPGTRIEWQARWWKGSMLGFEAQITVREGDQETVRWVRLLYSGTRRYYLVAEAPSYDYAAQYPSFLAMMLTFWPE